MTVKTKDYLVTGYKKKALNYSLVIKTFENESFKTIKFDIFIKSQLLKFIIRKGFRKNLKLLLRDLNMLMLLGQKKN